MLESTGNISSSSTETDGSIEVYRGCFFCKSGKEADVVRHFKAVFPKDMAVAPTRTRYRRTREGAIEERAPLLPGYVFFEIREAGTQAPEIVDEVLSALQSFARADSVLRLLKYTDGDWRLRGFDDRFAKMLLNTGGNIGLSQAWFDEGRRIRIVDGFLKDYEGSIVRVNRKAKTVEVGVNLQGKRVSMWLGYELVEAVGNDR